MAPPGNPAAGENIFRNKCAQCHTVDKGAGHKQGLNLNGLSGSQSGTAAGYSYSVDNRNLAVTWDEKTLFCLQRAQRMLGMTESERPEYDRFRECLFLPGTKEHKIFPGVKTPQERADLIAYLKKSTAS